MKTFVHEGAYRGEDLLKKIAAQPITLCGVRTVEWKIIQSYTKLVKFRL
jgi:hypothetical protein